MKKLFVLLIVLALSVHVKAQNDITIGLVMPDEEIDGVKPDAYQLLQSKLESMLTSVGVSAFGGDFVMYPTVNIIEENLVEGGIKNFFKVKIELNLNVANLTTKTLFSSESWLISGFAERVRSMAVRNAFSQLKGNDPRFKTFIEKTKQKICAYYEANKAEIFSRATTLASSGEYEEAVAILSSYPSQVNGYDEAQKLLHKIYVDQIDANAAKILNEARAAFATKQYAQAVNLAAQIDPDSSHYPEATDIINNVRATIDREKSEENARVMQALEIAADVEKTRINAVASVAKAYYGRRVVNYNVVRVY